MRTRTVVLFMQRREAGRRWAEEVSNQETGWITHRRCPPQRLVCYQAGLRAYEGINPETDPGQSPSRAIAQWRKKLPITHLPLRGQRRTLTGFPFHSHKTPLMSGEHLKNALKL